MTLLHRKFSTLHSTLIEDLSWEFPKETGHGKLTQEFCVAIVTETCCELFGYVSKSFSYERKPCLCGSKPFLNMSKTFLYARFSLLIVFLFAIVTAVLGHSTVDL